MSHRIGVLALQGAFAEHRASLNALGVENFEIRQTGDLCPPVDGLILPGGESTVIGKLLRELGLFSPIHSLIREGVPVMGTCAGLLLLAKTIAGGGAWFQTMDITARRNAYGRQLGSFYTESMFRGLGRIPMTFIRAPYIESVGDGVEVLAEVDGHIVAARQGNQLVMAFHPELRGDLSVDRYFISTMRI